MWSLNSFLNVNMHFCNFLNIFIQIDVDYNILHFRSSINLFAFLNVMFHKQYQKIIFESPCFFMQYFNA
jgi:hypothetical protein